MRCRTGGNPRPHETQRMDGGRAYSPKRRFPQREPWWTGLESNQPLRIFSPLLSPFELPVQSLRRVPFPRRTTFGWDNAPPIPLRIHHTDLLCNASCREIAFFGAVPASIPGIRYFRVASNHSTSLTARIAARSTPSVFNVGVRPMPTPCRSFTG